jgi:hypothetical protein
MCEFSCAFGGSEARDGEMRMKGAAFSRETCLFALTLDGIMKKIKVCFGVVWFFPARYR